MDNFEQQIFGEDVEVVEPVALSSPEMVEELQELLRSRSEIDSRIRRITGESNIKKALGAAETIINTFHIRAQATAAKENLPPDYPDDRSPSVSIHTVTGGLPSLGKGKK